MQLLLIAAALVFGSAPTVRLPVKVAAPAAVPRLTLAVANQSPLTGLSLVNPQPLLALVPQPAVTLSPVESNHAEGAQGGSALTNLTASVEKLAEQPEAELSSSFDGVTRSLAGARYDVFEPGYEARFELKQGVLQSRIKTRDEKGRAKGIYAKNEFASALKIFKAGVHAVEGNWVDGELGSSDNLAAFNALTKAGLSAEQAALGTWTGRQAAKAGFTKVVLLPGGKFMLEHQQPGGYTSMSVLFVRPEDHHVDRQGGVWRRTRNRKGWERWEKDSEVIRIHRLRVKDSIAVYEYLGASAPEPGAPWNAMATFSLKDGRMLSHVIAKDSVLLRAKAEFRSAFRELGATSIKGSWTFEDNLAEFNRLTGLGLAPEQAALQTWTGKLASELGLTKVSWGEQTKINLSVQRPGRYTGIAPLYERP